MNMVPDLYVRTCFRKAMSFEWAPTQRIAYAGKKTS